MARIDYVTSFQVAAADRSLFDTGYNLHKVSLHSPGLAQASRQLGLYLRNQSPLDARLRELAILQVAYALDGEYEYAHHLKIGLQCGVTPEDLLAIAQETEGGQSELDEGARLVLRAARELAHEPGLPQSTFDALAAMLDPSELVDLIYAIGFYVGFLRFTASFAIEVEAEYTELLDSYPMRPPLIV